MPNSQETQDSDCNNFTVTAGESRRIWKIFPDFIRKKSGTNKKTATAPGLSRLLRPLPKQVREYSRYCYFRPAGVLPEVLYQTSGSTPQEYSQCKILRGLGVLPEVLYQTCGSTPTKMVREGSGSTPRPLKIIHWECS